MGDLLRTFWRNSFGSDELEHYTAEYTWLANQMAHAMMAFCLVTCWALFVFNMKQRAKSEAEKLAALRLRVAAEEKAESAEATSPAAPAQAREELAAAEAKVAERGWFTRQLFDASTDLLMTLPFLLLVLKEIVDITSDAIQFSGGPVAQRYRNPLLDSVTDLTFWYAGMFLALLIASRYFDQQRYRLPGALIGFGVCLGIGYFWLGTVWQNQKKVFDRSGLPLNYVRLVKLSNEWNNSSRPGGHPFRDERRDLQNHMLADIQALAAGDDEGARSGEPTAHAVRGHFVLTGGFPEDRSKLAVSIGCEFAFRLRFDERSPSEAELRKVIYTTAVQALDHPEGLLNDNSKSALRCVIIDDLDVTIDPPIELLTAATEVFPKLGDHYSTPTKKRIELAAAGRTVSEDLRRRLASGRLWAEPRGGGDHLLKVELDDIKAVVKASLSPKERADDERRAEIFKQIRKVLTDPNSRISTIWVLSNTGVKRPNPDAPDPQANDREKWLYLIAYLAGTTREALENGRIEFVRRPVAVDPQPHGAPTDAHK